MPEKKENIIDLKLMFEGAATLVIALAINNTMREVISHIWPNNNKIAANVIYTIITVLIVVITVFIINNIAKSETMTSLIEICCNGSRHSGINNNQPIRRSSIRMI